MMLSPHFALSELTASQEAVRRRIDNTPDAARIENLRRLADTLEQVRTVLSKPITINSGYRCLTLNRAIGSKDTSEHVDGRAADIICPAYGNPWQVARAIAKAGIEYNQLILEYGAWVHISIPVHGVKGRGEMLTYRHDAPVVRGLIA